jgi:uncharacterized protein
MATKVKARTISKGYGEGEALVSQKALGFNLGVDVETGTVTESGHPLQGVSFKGKVLVFPNGKGSTGGSYVVYQLFKKGTAPNAIINVATDTIVAAGVIMAGLPTVDHMKQDPYKLIKTGDYVKVDATKGTVEVIKKGEK